MDIYKHAVRFKLLFSSVRGDLTFSQLFELPLSSANGFCLDAVAKRINADLKACGEESFVASAPNPQKRHLEIALDIVKDVIATKVAENAAAALKIKRAEERRKILDIIGEKKDEQLSKASIKELEKKLAALDDEEPLEAVG